MCGICGIVHVDQSAVVDTAALATMNASLVHRGPDEDGFHVDGNVGLAMRRLKVIDLATGQQPVFSEDRNVCVVLNGEIYNFRELRKSLEGKGHRLRTMSDTETIVHLYEEYGDDCVDHLRGMFAFALWDRTARRLLLARDRLGIKPLHYAFTSGVLVFGSEIKAVIRHPSVGREIDPDAVYSYLSLTYIPAPATVFKQVRKLLPGHRLVCDAHGVRIDEYWDVPVHAARHRSQAQFKAELGEVFQEAIPPHLVSDVPLGAFLSGGVDSSAVVAVASQANPTPLRTFSVGFGDRRFDESADARFVANAFHTSHQEFVVEPGAVTPDLVAGICRQVDEPFADSSMIPTYLLSGLARAQVTVALSGDGGDELFGGYPYYRHVAAFEQAQRLPLPARAALVWLMKFADRSMLLSGNRRRQVRRFAGLFEMTGDEVLQAVKVLFGSAEKADLLTPEFLATVTERDLTARLQPYLAKLPAAPMAEQLLYLDLKTSLPDDMLTKVDRMSMLHSLEVRVPLLDHKVVEFAASMPSDWKATPRHTKHVFKDALRGLVPERTLNKRKMGFEIPLHSLATQKMMAFFRDVLSERQIKAEGVFRWTEVERLLAMFSAADDSFTGDISRRQVNLRLWAIVSFQLWSASFQDAPQHA